MNATNQGWRQFGAGGVSVSAVLVETPDITDNQLSVRSTLGRRTYLTRGFKDEFSFGVSDLVVIVNHGSEPATVRLTTKLAPQDAIVICASRGPTKALRRDEDWSYRLQADEHLIIRSAHAIEPKSRTRDRPEGLTIRSGMQVAG